jgi:hypothetical protein
MEMFAWPQTLTAVRDMGWGSSRRAGKLPQDSRLPDPDRRFVPGCLVGMIPFEWELQSGPGLAIEPRLVLLSKVPFFSGSPINFRSTIS